MVRFASICFLALVGVFVGESAGRAQVFVRAPFVRVYVGNGVYVRAPFFSYSNMWASPGPAVAEPGTTEEQLPPVMPPKKAPAQQQKPADKGTQKAMSLDEFAKTFQPRGGVHEVTLINPLTQAPTPVRFLLPEGMPRGVMVDPQGVEFRYGLRHFVRIHFNSDGVVVTSR
jgi:hypothetical protein